MTLSRRITHNPTVKIIKSKISNYLYSNEVISSFNIEK